MVVARAARSTLIARTFLSSPARMATIRSICSAVCSDEKKKRSRAARFGTACERKVRFLARFGCERGFTDALWSDYVEMYGATVATTQALFRQHQSRKQLG